MTFQPGISGNPLGRPQADGLSAAIRLRGEELIAELFRIALGNGSANAKVRALEMLLDRGYGKPLQTTQIEQTNKFVIFAPQVIADPVEWQRQHGAMLIEQDGGSLAAPAQEPVIAPTTNSSKRQRAKLIDQSD